MTERDEHDEMVERLLPCCTGGMEGEDHQNWCPCVFRPAVAAELRAGAKIIDTLQNTCAGYEARLIEHQKREAEHQMFHHQHRDCDAMDVDNQRMRKELADLRAECERLKAAMDSRERRCNVLIRQIDQLKAQLGEAEKRGMAEFIRGLEWAKGLTNNEGQCTTRAHDVIDLQIAETRAAMEGDDGRKED